MLYGNVHPIGYRVNGLLNSDSPDVLTGVLLDKAFFDTTAPGVYLYGFSEPGHRAELRGVVGSAAIPHDRE